MLEKPKFVQGVFAFQGKGLTTPFSLSPAVTYKVPADKRCQLTYFRAGNSSADLIYFLVKRDGNPMRYFPVGAKSAIHLALAVTEDLHPDTTLDVQIAAPAGSAGEAVIDIGLMEF
jgi:hypothetical protein